MRGSQDKAFKAKLIRLIIDECEVQTDLEIDQIEDDVPLFGADSQLGLDSIDGFQMALAVEKTYGIKITDGKEMRRVMASINTFADFLQPE
jgi:acyl carrier protein